MVGVSLKNGVEINTADTERFKIIKLLLNALEITAEIVVLCYSALAVGLPERLTAPVGTQNSVFGYTTLRLARIAESVGKNLINNGAFYPLGCGKLP